MCTYHGTFVFSFDSPKFRGVFFVHAVQLCVSDWSQSLRLCNEGCVCMFVLHALSIPCNMHKAAVCMHLGGFLSFLRL